MSDLTRFDATIGVADVYRTAIEELYAVVRRRTRIRILVVVDGGISLTEGPSAFGVGRVVRLLRGSNVGCTTFKVDLALRNGAKPTTNPNPAVNVPRYSGFRFDQTDNGVSIINRYDEVWCFGFNPDNDAETDANITQPGAFPTSDAELRVLTTWMNEKRGGLLAMGDHDYLGASMCHRIPRVRSMRRWTNAQGVPPIGGFGDADTALRLDTNQPATPGQLAGTDIIPFSVQEDARPQHNTWVPWIAQQVNIFTIRQRPHPVLCHPTLGPIDVLPDHPHEGWCYEDDEIDLTATYSFGGLSGDEYPTVDGDQPRPRVIAHGTTTPNPPFRLAKGPSPRKTFAQINVYDGHPANVGRVVTDATWHHWFDENITAIEAAGGDDWKKISRYYLNVATWLAPPAVSDWCFPFEIATTHFGYLGFQEYTRKASVFDLGAAVQQHLVRRYGPCWVTSWVLEKIRLVDADIWAWLKDRLFWKDGIPVPGTGCLSCPPFELLEIAVLGGLVRAGFPLTQRIKRQMERDPDADLELDAERLVVAQLEGVSVGIAEFRQALGASVDEVAPLLGAASQGAGASTGPSPEALR